MQSSHRYSMFSKRMTVHYVADQNMQFWRIYFGKLYLQHSAFSVLQMPWLKCLNVQICCEFSHNRDKILILTYNVFWFILQTKTDNGKSKSYRNKKTKGISSLQVSMLCLILSGSLLTFFISKKKCQILLFV